MIAGVARGPPVGGFAGGFAAPRAAAAMPPAGAPPPIGPDTVLDEVVDAEPAVGVHLGRVKWFDEQLGFGFITLYTDWPDKGCDVFVHHTGVRPATSHFRWLLKNEYCSFNLGAGPKGPQAVDVTGVKGGPLMCDIYPPPRRPTQFQQPDSTLDDRAVNLVGRSSNGFDGRFDNRFDGRFDTRFDTCFDNRLDHRFDNRFENRYGPGRSTYSAHRSQQTMRLQPPPPPPPPPPPAPPPPGQYRQLVFYNNGGASALPEYI
jgi:CspA family cold shock protein